jgi:FtsP/CotA-like multicopper oxidase with cupredoxin domain
VALRKFVDGLPGLGATKANNLGQFISVAHPDTLTYPGTDYYEIAVQDFTERMHSDLAKATKLRGYVQVNMGTNAAGTANNVPPDPQHYLGPIIIAQKDRPVRVKFINKLGIGAAGNLFIPVDTTIMGAGMGPSSFVWNPVTNTFDPTGVMDMYGENRAELHLHGGHTPWISDGTPHQWITPFGDPTIYKKGVSLYNVPDMPDPGVPTVQGSSTYYYTNAQSSRLMFYHDHSYGITRLNVYAGEAAAYLLRDAVEAALEANGTLPALAYNLPLVIQDKTFVPNDVAVQDALWDSATWGQPGDLWFPHVYETNQNPAMAGGMNPMGRWDYGPWFWPPALVTNPVLPTLSIVPEAFMDTMVVNGTAYPYANVEPRRYRLRLLNASNDRTLNLQLYKADASGTEVTMVAAPDARLGGVPDPTTAGPAFINIATESGFLPAPMVANDPTAKQLYVGYDKDPRSITYGNINSTNLLLGPAQRADVIVDFSTLAPGTKLILYNDAPAPAPMGDARVDYYTGDGDHTAIGGAPNTLAGYGPNTRTVMQFRVVPLTGTADPETFATTLAKLQDPSPTSTTGLAAAFAKAQEPLPFPPGTVVNNFTNYVTDVNGNKIPILRKAIQELFDPTYGRMNALLGTELQWTNGQNQNTNFNYYTDLPSEIIPQDQTQIWMIVHNGVDTHFIHTHLFSVQIVGRVDWAGVVKPPYPDEIGWRETFRADPLEQIIVAARAVKPPVPFSLPDSVRTLDVTMPSTGAVGSTWSATTNPNPLYNLGWEYVWHCHLLGHEENDMMRPLVFKVPTTPPTAATAVAAAVDPVGRQINVTWSVNQNVIDEIAYRIERDSGAGFTKLADVQYVHNMPQTFFPSGQPNWPLPIYSDPTAAAGVAYTYRVTAFNAFGQTLSTTAAATLPVIPKATGVTLTPSLPSPHVTGTAVTFTAAGQGSTGYQYRFWQSTDGGLTFTVVQDWSPTATWTLAAAAPLGTYLIIADVRTDPGSPIRDAYTWLNYSVVATALPHATGVTLTPSLVSPQPPGTAVVFTAAGQGSSGYQYRFWLSTDNGNTFSVVQDWSATATWTLAATNPAGGYVVLADVKTDPSSTLRDAYTAVTYVLQAGILAPATGVTLTASAPSPHVAGTAVTFTAAGQGSTSYQYRFWQSANGGLTFTMVQDWSATATWTLPATTPVGTYLIIADVKSNLSATVRDAYTWMNYAIVNAAIVPATGVTLTAGAPSPHVAGTGVIFTATGQGGSGGYRYRFWESADGGVTFTVVQDWSATATWTLPATTAVGTYLVIADVTTDPVSTIRDAYTWMSYAVVSTALAPATGVTLTPSLPSPQKTGTAVIFTAAGQGSSGYLYRFWLSADGGVTFTVVQDWSATATWTLPATTAVGTYQVIADVKTDPAASLRDAYTWANYSITP